MANTYEKWIDGLQQKLVASQMKTIQCNSQSSDTKSNLTPSFSPNRPVKSSNDEKKLQVLKRVYSQKSDGRKGNFGMQQETKLGNLNKTKKRQKTDVDSGSGNKKKKQSAPDESCQKPN